MDEIRVLQFLDDEEIKKVLLKNIPKDIKCPNLDKHKYPQKLISIFPNTYSDFGVITEELLKKKPTSKRLKKLIKKYTNIDVEDKILELKSTEHYLEKVAETRKLLKSEIKENDLLYDIELSLDIKNGRLLGHPDILAGNTVYEVKTSGLVEKKWKDFILQVIT